MQPMLPRLDDRASSRAALLTVPPQKGAVVTTWLRMVPGLTVSDRRRRLIEYRPQSLHGAGHRSAVPPPGSPAGEGVLDQR